MPSTNDTPSNDSPSLRDRADEVLGSAREKAIEAYDSARESAASASRKAGDQLAEAPLIALGAGLAAGALVAALLPKTRAEEKLLGPVGERVAGAGREAIDAARLAGTTRLEELDITRDAGAKLVRSLIEGLGEAAQSSGRAAVGSFRTNIKPTE